MQGLKTALTAYWQRLAEREKWAVGVAGVAVLAAVVWWVAIAPALKTLRQAPLTLQQLDLQLAQMQGLALEAERLRQTPSISASQAEAALRAATVRLSDEVNLNIQGDRATVSLSNVPGWALAPWLAEVRVGAHARPESAQLNKVSEHNYSGTIVLVLSHSNSEYGP